MLLSDWMIGVVYTALTRSTAGVGIAGCTGLSKPARQGGRWGFRASGGDVGCYQRSNLGSRRIWANNMVYFRDIHAFIEREACVGRIKEGAHASRAFE